MRVLLILDSAPALKQSLKEEGFAVDQALDGADGNRRAVTNNYDLIVVNPALLAGDGFAVLKDWRRQEIEAHVLVVSMKKSAASKVRALDAGADDYLTQPFHLEELLARVRALMRRACQIKDPVVRVFDLEIDTVARTVHRAGRQIHLTPREFAVLHLLAYHCGKPVSRTMIRQHLYEDYQQVTSNVVDVYIRFLRAKIDRGFEPELILTRRGTGYLLRKESDVPSPALRFADAFGSGAAASLVAADR
jgi:DNA-binding response OmpR family regulator